MIGNINEGNPFARAVEMALATLKVHGAMYSSLVFPATDAFHNAMGADDPDDADQLQKFCIVETRREYQLAFECNSK